MKKPAPPEPSTADVRRKELLEAAFGLIAEKGLEGLRTRDIADRVGINIATLHYYFESKDDLVMAVLGYVREKFAEQARAAATEKTAEETLKIMFTPGRHARVEARAEVAAVIDELGLRARRDEKVRAVFVEMYQEWNRHIAELLRRGIEEGSVRPDIDPKSAAAVLTSFWLGARTQLGNNPKAFDMLAASSQLHQWLRKSEP